jgi:hypothetical protein
LAKNIRARLLLFKSGAIFFGRGGLYLAEKGFIGEKRSGIFRESRRDNVKGN